MKKSSPHTTASVVLERPSAQLTVSAQIVGRWGNVMQSAGTMSELGGLVANSLSVILGEKHAQRQLPQQVGSW